MTVTCEPIATKPVDPFSRLPKRCVKCRESTRSIMFFTLLETFGAKVSRGGMVCPKGGEHRFYFARDRRTGRFVRSKSAFESAS
jgi:hypothetical protein